MTSPAHDVLVELLTQFPEAATKTLATIAYKKHPKLWTSLETCRSAVRLIRGQCGAKNRAEIADKTHYKDRRATNSTIPALPEGLTDITDYSPHVIPVPCTALVLCDLHMPYHSKSAIELAVKDAHKSHVDTLILDGDIGDHYAASHWEKDPRRRDYQKEREIGVEGIKWFTSEFRKARRIAKLGNHDERIEAYLKVKAPEFYGVPEFQMRSLWKFDELGWEVVDDLRPMLLGGLYIIHGHEYRFAISNPVNPARGLFLRSKVLAITGHFHQTSQHSENSMSGKVMSCWSIGCACDLHPRYMPLNKWNLGYAIVHVDEDGAFNVENKRIIDGKAYT